MSHVSTVIKTAEKSANAKEAIESSPIKSQSLEFKVRVVCDKLDTTSPKNLKAANRPRHQESQLSQKESESDSKEMKSNEEPTEYQREMQTGDDVDIVMLETNVPGKQTKDTLMEVTNSSNVQTPQVSGKPKSKFSQGTLSSPASGGVNQGKTVPPSCSGNTSIGTSPSTFKIHQGLENLRKMLKSTSFTMPGVRTPRKSDTSVKNTNNGSGNEEQAAIKRDVKVEAGSHQGAEKGEASMRLIVCVSAVTNVIKFTAR